jgi:hypothetical protein
MLETLFIESEISALRKGVTALSIGLEATMDTFFA